MTIENARKMNSLKNNKFIRIAILVIGMVLSTPALFGQGLFKVLPDTLIWSADNLTAKEFSIVCRQDWWQADVSNCQGLYQFDMTEGYDMCIVTVTPLQANTSASDRHVAVVLTRSNGATATLHLIHQGVPPPEPEPEPDPWLDEADDLASTWNWIQKTTVTAADGSSSYRDIEWYDGLGYKDQLTLVGASTGGKSIVTPIVYDRMRRDDARTYLPYADNLPDTLFMPDAVSRQTAYYASPSIYGDSRPFAEKVYESSPSGRPLSWQREGDKWDEDGGHRITFSYRVNTLSDSVWRYRITPGTDVASYAGLYPEGSLLCTETEGEDGGITRTYADALGRTVCTEQVTDDGERARTLYVRDVRDSVAVVIQPEGVKALKGLTDKSLSLLPGSGTNHGVSDAYCFIWKYDWHGNLLSDHVPCGGTMEYAYDSRNREVLRTDSRMSPAGGGAYKMIFSTYDQYDRLTHQIYASCNVPISTMRPLVANGPSSTLPSAASSHLTPIRPLRIAEYFPFTSFSYPTTGNYAYVAEDGFANAPETVRVKGLLKQETLYGAPDIDGSLPSGTPYLTRAYHYDSKGRVIQTIERWSDSWTRRVSTGYSFTGEVLSTKETVTPPGGSPHVMATRYTRDERGRLLSCERMLDGADTLAAVHYAYDPLGRVSVKRVGEDGSDNDNGNGSGGAMIVNPATLVPSLLKTSYSYDLHGWLTGIQVSGRNELGYSDTLFEELLHYESPKKDPMARRFDGNISETTFRHWAGIPSGGSASFHAPNEDTWSYAYDALKRLTDANHFVGLSQTSSLADTEREIAYDLNGNMIALKRYNSTGLENDLAFLHTGNRMTSLSDAHATGSGAGPKTFTYDANGNLTYDGRQDLDIQWNIFNLASGAETHDGGSLTLARLSDGTLFAQHKENGGNTTGKRYCGSFVFTTGTGITTPQVESVAWDEGRIFRDAQTGAYRDCWFAGDHLGNIRSVLDITPDVTFPVPLEQNDYLPFGTKIANPLHAQMNTNRWRYAGKEEFPDLNLLEFGARMYDSFTARWTAVDPMAGKYTGTSPYAYCADNPVNLVDYTGMELSDYYSLKGKLLMHIDDGEDGKYFILNGSDVNTAINNGDIFPVPSGEVITKMSESFKATAKDGKERGFRVGNNGEASIIVTGSNTEITNEQWAPAVDDLRENHHTMVSYDVHTHPKDNNYSTNVPSETDKNNVVGHWPNVLLGYEHTVYSNTDFTGSTTVTHFDTPQIIFYNHTGVIGSPMDYSSFLKSVKRTNKN